MNAPLRALQARCRALWQALAPRERLLVAGCAAVLGAGLCVWLVLVADKSRTELRTSVPALRARAALLEQHAAEFERLRAAPAATVSRADIRALVQAQTIAAGLSRALVSMEAGGADQLKVTLGSVSFADWLKWVASLESQHVHLVACKIEALSTPGLVSVSATLARPQQQ